MNVLRDRLIEAIAETLRPNSWNADFCRVLAMTGTWDNWLVLYQFEECTVSYMWFGNRTWAGWFVTHFLIPAGASWWVADVRYVTYQPSEAILEEELAGVDWDALFA